MGVEEQADSLDEGKVAIVMEIAEVIQRGVGKISYHHLLEMCQRKNY